MLSHLAKRSSIRWAACGAGIGAIDFSGRLVSRDLLHLRRNLVFGRFQIVLRLNVQPERRHGLEKLAEPQSGIGGHGRFFAHQALDSSRPHDERRGNSSMRRSWETPNLWRASAATVPDV